MKPSFFKKHLKDSKNIAKNSFFIIGGKLVIFAISFAFIMGLANLLPKEVVGSFNYVISILGIVSIATLAGMNTALTRAVARGHEGSMKYMMRQRIKFGLIGSLASFGIGIFYLIQGESTLAYVFMIAAPFVPLTDTFSEMAYAFFQGRKNFKKIVFLSMLCQALFSLPTLAVILISDNLIIITTSFLLFQTIGGLTVYQMARPDNSERDPASERFGYHLTLMSALRTISINIDRVIVWHFAGAAAVAAYIFAATPMSKVEQLVPIEIIALPELSKQTVTHELKKKLLFQTLLLIACMLPVITIGYWLTPFIFSHLFPMFPESIALFRVFLFVLLFLPFSLMTTLFKSQNHTKDLYIIETVSPAIKIILMILFGSLYGIWGVVFGNVLGRAAEAGITLILFIRSKVQIVV